MEMTDTIDGLMEYWQKREGYMLDESESETIKAITFRELDDRVRGLVSGFRERKEQDLRRNALVKKDEKEVK